MHDYEVLDTATGVDALVEASHAAPQVIFKHSTSCSISHLAKARVDKALRGGEFPYPISYLDLLRYRAVSDYVADRLGIPHESPQLIVLSGGAVSYAASHLDIDPYALTAVAERRS